MKQITLKIAEITEIKPAIDELMTLPMPILTSYKVSKLYKSIFDELTIIDEKRKEVYLKYGTEKINEKNESFIEIKPECMKDFKTEYDALLQHEVSFKIEPIKISELGNANLPPRIFIILDKILSE
jgi:hypothetical protein